MRTASVVAIFVPVICSVILLLASYIGQPTKSLRPKIFVLGLSKTGTTSIGDALGMLGYRRMGWRVIRSHHLVHTWLHGDHSALLALTRYYDAFEDLPWPFMYAEVAQMYPDARFILSVRKDEATWLRSMRTHVGRGKWLPHNDFYGADDVDGHEEVVLGSYRNHTARVRDFFRDQPHRFMELNIDDGDMNWFSLCQLAQCGPNGTIPSVGFPKSNTAESWEVGPWQDALQWIVGWTMARLEERISFYYYVRAWPALNRLLSACWWAYDIVERAVVELYYRLGYGDDILIRFPRQAMPVSF